LRCGRDRLSRSCALLSGSTRLRMIVQRLTTATISRLRTLWWYARLVPPPRIADRRTKTCLLPDLDAICVYRARNAWKVRRMVEGLSDARWALWSLDEIDDSLAQFTVGCGPAPRTLLHNKLELSLPRHGTPRWLLATDDDIEVPAGQLDLLRKVSLLCHFDLAQPAASPTSQGVHEFVRARGLTIARRTHFVESGPLLLFSPRGRQSLLPYPENAGMGWGSEARWWTLSVLHDLALGVVDCARYEHFGSPGGLYANEPEMEILLRELASAGLKGFDEIQSTVRRWSIFDALKP